jgi:teichuronic acid biosynthesis glycosyltransferase TuaC
MKVLFVSSGNAGKFNPLIKAQYKSLIDLGLEMDSYLIKGKGIFGYLKNISRIRKMIKSNRYDVVHAHFSYSAFAVTLAFPKNLVVSLMGSDLKEKWFTQKFSTFLSKYWWKSVIVKSQEMYDINGVKDAKILPNGVDFSIFKPIERELAIAHLGWNSTKKHIVFAGNPKNYIKNFPLAEQAIDYVNSEEIEIHVLGNIPHEEIPIIFNAADVVLLTSLWEGSPNVIKEALACNRPIVATECGDVKLLLDGVDGCFVTDYNYKNIGDSILKALNYEKSNGRNRIFHLDSRIIAQKIKEVYLESISKALN